MRSRALGRCVFACAAVVALLAPAAALGQVSLPPVQVPGGDQPVNGVTNTVHQTVTTVQDTANRTVANTEGTVNGVVNGVAGSGGDGGSGPSSPEPTHGGGTVPPPSTGTGGAPQISTAPSSGETIPGGSGKASATGGSGGSPSQANGGGTIAAGGGAGAGAAHAAQHQAKPAPTTTTEPSGFIRDVAELPWAFFAACIGLAILGVLMSGRSAFFARVARRLRLQKEELEEDVGALQQALLPAVPRRLGAVDISVAYRPAEGPAAGGDFHDVVRIDEKRIGVVVGDVSGHGRDALTATALVHYTVRAYLETGMAPGEALRLADRALDGKLGGHFATAVAAIYDSTDSTLTYSSAGHPAPLLSGSASDDAVESVNAPPIGVGPPTGWRETTVAVKSGTRIVFITDGLTESREKDGSLLGRRGLADALGDLPPQAGAADLLDVVSGAEPGADDLTVCILDPTDARRDGSIVEDMELTGGQALREGFQEFLRDCGLEHDEAKDASDQLALLSRPPRRGLHLTIRRDAHITTWESDYEREAIPRTSVQTLPRRLERTA
jgi:hypothetical protein